MKGVFYKIFVSFGKVMYPDRFMKLFRKYITTYF